MGCLSFSNFWKKTEEKKDGLDLYKYGDYFGIFYLTNCDCPICGGPMSENIIKNLEELKNKGPKIIRELRKNYCDLVKRTNKYDFNEEDVDIFNKLEEIQIKIDDYLNQYDNNKYYKYQCENKNSECYLMLYNLPKEKIFDEYFNDRNYIEKEYEFSQWKNDENLKKKLLKEKEEILLKKKLNEIHNQIWSEWNAKTFNMEHNKYLEAVKNINQKIEYEKSRFTGFEYGHEVELMSVFNMYSNGFKYASAKNNLIDYIAKFAIDENEERIIRLNNKFAMTKQEEKEYEIFEKEKLKKYLNKE